MYKSFYKLDRKPFEIFPDNSFVWLGENHKEVFSTLRYGVLENKGFLLLTGEAGVGKTSLIKALTKSFDSDVAWAVIDDPTLERIDFYNEIARNFGIDKKFTSKVQFLIQFSHFLHKADDDKKKVLLVVDQCHLLSQEMLEELRLLSNIEKADSKLINIFFVGEHSFNDLLGQPKNRAVRQRLTLINEVPKLTANETADYIRHRLEKAGAESEIFTAKACQAVHRYSGGMALEINKICETALKLGASEQLETVTPALIDKVLNKVDATVDLGTTPVAEVNESSEQPAAPIDYSQFKLGDSPESKITGFNVEADNKPAWLKFGLATLAVLAVGAFFFINDKTKVTKTELPPAAQEQVVAEPTKELPPVSESPAVTVMKESKEEVDKGKVEELKTAILEKAYQEERETPVAGGESKEKVAAAVESVATEQPQESQPEVEEQVDEVVVAAKEDSDTVEPAAPATPEIEIIQVPAREAVVETEAVAVREDVVSEIISQPEPEPEPEPEVVQARLEPRKVLLPLLPNSLKLTKKGTKAFEIFTEKLLDYPKATILIKGFVSSKSNSPENIKLSEDRALAVYKMMLKKGVDPEQIEMEGMGNREPIASNDTRAGRTKNRRVEILVIRDGLE